MSYKYIKYEVEERVLTITLNRPERLNAFLKAMREEIILALDRAEEDDEIRAIIVTGAGRAFSAGMDLEEGGSTLIMMKSPRMSTGMAGYIGFAYL